jgi:hypothetical protein
LFLLAGAEIVGEFPFLELLLPRLGAHSSFGSVMSILR